MSKNIYSTSCCKVKCKRKSQNSRDLVILLTSSTVRFHKKAKFKTFM